MSFSKIITRRISLPVVLGLFFGMVLLGVVATPEATYAIIGSGGDPAGGGGGAQSKNGWGWYRYSVDGNPQPQGFKDKSKWADVSQACRNAGTDQVIAFIVLTAKGSDPNKGVVYQYKSSWDAFSNHRSGGNWLATSDAKSLYDSVGDDKTGYTWGGNVAWFCYSDQTHWRVDSYTGIKKANTNNVSSDSGWGTGDITATPGETLYWKHVLTARDARIDKTLNWGLRGSGFPAGFALTNNGGSIPPSSNIQNGASFVQLGSYPGASPGYTIFTVSASDVTKRFCQHIDWSPLFWGNGSTGSSDEVCATVPYNYSLDPKISVPANEVEVGSSIAVLPAIDNSGPTQTDGTQWQLSYITIPSGGGIPAATNTSSDPCSFYGGGGRTCAPANFTSGGAATGTDVFSVGTSNFTTRNAEVGDLPVGTQVCYALSVRARSSSANEWRHSKPDCAIVSKRPVMQVFGGDVLAGRGLATGSIISTNVKNTGGKRYGSWAEYGIVASGSVTGMASASGYAGGVTPTSLCGVSYLSFANKEGASSCSDAKIGRYTFKSGTSTIAGRFPAAGGVQIAGAQDIAGAGFQSGKTYTNNAAGADILLTSAPSASIPTGKWFVINAPNATVKIMNNIVYTNAPLASVADIPQVIIIAKNIIIADAVTQVDAWLVATGTGAEGKINTCGAGGVTETTPLTAGLCAAKLTVNGPIAANHLLLRRTAGAGTNANSGDAAEVFNLRPDAYMWASNLQSSTVKAQTVITTELPPRY